MLEILDYCNRLAFATPRQKEMLQTALMERAPGKPAGLTWAAWIDSILWRFGSEHFQEA